MIVRVFTGRVAARREGDFNANLRARLADIAMQPGNTHVKFARKMEGDRERVMLVTEWESAADLYVWTGGDVDRPHSVDLDMLDEWEVAHWEALDPTPLGDSPS